VGIEDFSKLYKNPLDPYSSDNYVTESDIYKKAMSKGASEEYARDIAKRYGEMYKEGGSAWRWNSKDPNELALKMGKLKAAKEAAAAKAKADSERNTTATRTSNVIGEIIEMKSGSRKKAGRNDINAFLIQYGFNKDSDGIWNPPKGLKVYDQLKPGDEKFMYDLSKGRDIQWEDYVALPGPDGTVKRYLRGQVTYDDPTSYWGGILSAGGDYGDLPFDDVLGITSVKDKSIERNWGNDVSHDVWTGHILLDLEDYLKEGHIVMEMNKQIGVNENADFTFGSTTNEDMQLLAQQELLFLAEALEMSPEEVLEANMVYQNEKK
jgi:hypothetical protein